MTTIDIPVTMTGHLDVSEDSVFRVALEESNGIRYWVGVLLSSEGLTRPQYIKSKPNEYLRIDGYHDRRVTADKFYEGWEFKVYEAKEVIK